MFAWNSVKSALCLAALASALTGCSKPETSADNDTSVTPEALAAMTAFNPNDPVSIMGLISIAEAKLAFKPADEFSKGYDDSFLEGKTFTLRLQVAPRGGTEESSAHYAYDADTEDFQVSLLPEAGSLNYPKNRSSEEFDYILTTDETTYGDEVPMSNAFGTTIKVTPVKHFQVGIGSIGSDYMGAIPHQKNTSYSIALKNIKLTPDQARAAAQDIWMEVSGTLKRSSGGELLKCVETEKPATIDYAYQENWKMCVFSAKIDRVSIVSKSAGLLAQWPVAKDDKTPGKYSTL